MTIPASAHTPGPWVALDIGEIVTENLEVCIATINGSDTSTVEEDEANARLIAAAPALVAALQDAVEGIDRGNLDQRYCCNGDMCGCQGSTYREFLLHNLRSALSLALGEQ